MLLKFMNWSNNNSIQFLKQLKITRSKHYTICIFLIYFSLFSINLWLFSKSFKPTMIIQHYLLNKSVITPFLSRSFYCTPSNFWMHTFSCSLSKISNNSIVLFILVLNCHYRFYYFLLHHSVSHQSVSVDTPPWRIIINIDNCLVWTNNWHRVCSFHSVIPRIFNG